MAIPAAAQSLGDIARQEEARRASAPKAVKTLSNADLDPSATAAAGDGAVESCYRSKSLGRCVAPEDLVSISNAGVQTKANAPYEESWRRLARSIRLQVDGLRVSVSQFETVVADSTRSVGDRVAAEKSLATASQTMSGLERQWQKLEHTVGSQQIPREWIEPVPNFAIRAPQ